MKKALAVLLLLAPLVANAGVIRFAAKKSYKYVAKPAYKTAKYVVKKSY